MNLFSLVVLIFFISACSTHRKPEALKPWKEFNSVSNSPAKCIAKISLNMKSDKERLSTLSKFNFSLNGSKSDLKITLYNPFGLTYAKLQINESLQTWTDKEKSFPLQKHPLFAKWYLNTWWDEVAFLFGRITPTAAPYISANKSRTLLQYSRNDRKISCEHGSKGLSRCKLTAKELQAGMNFTFVSCKDQL
jgi:hypothetical protein